MAEECKAAIKDVAAASVRTRKQVKVDSTGAEGVGAEEREASSSCCCSWRGTGGRRQRISGKMSTLQTNGIQAVKISAHARQDDVGASHVVRRCDATSA